MSRGSFHLKTRYLGQKVCLVARAQTHIQTDTKVNTEDILSRFQEYFLQPIIKDPISFFLQDNLSHSRTNVLKIWLQDCFLIAFNMQNTDFQDLGL